MSANDVAGLDEKRDHAGDVALGQTGALGDCFVTGIEASFPVGEHDHCDIDAAHAGRHELRLFCSGDAPTHGLAPTSPHPRHGEDLRSDRERKEA